MVVSPPPPPVVVASPPPAPADDLREITVTIPEGVGALACSRAWAEASQRGPWRAPAVRVQVRQQASKPSAARRPQPCAQQGPSGCRGVDACARELLV